MSHRFDTVTHRCKCGRWQAGFKPKTEPVKPRDECQICERQQALDANGRLVHHGYKRPGWGCIIGDCMGVGHLPYPATDALVRYLAVVKNYIAKCEADLVALPDVTELPFHWKEWVDRKQVDRATMIVKGEPLPRCGNYCVPDFDNLLKVRKANLENEISFASREQARVEARIAMATKSLTPGA